jgi:hypothetical protein
MERERNKREAEERKRVGWRIDWLPPYGRKVI